jgi:hypothetical protein
VNSTSTFTEFRIGGYQIPSFWYLDDVSVTDITTTGTSQAVMGPGIANGVAAAPGPLTAGGGSGAPVLPVTPGDGLGPTAVRALGGQQAGPGGLASASAGQGAPAQGALAGVNVTALDEVFASRMIRRAFSSFRGHQPASDLGDEFSLAGLPA